MLGVGLERVFFFFLFPSSPTALARQVAVAFVILYCCACSTCICRFCIFPLFAKEACDETIGLINLISARCRIQLAWFFPSYCTVTDLSLLALKLLTPSRLSPTARRIVTTNPSTKGTT